MVITNLEYAEKMVSKHDDLMWDGWTIVQFTPNTAAELKPQGRRINGVWGFIKEYVPTEIGWEVPNKYVR